MSYFKLKFCEIFEFLTRIACVATIATNKPIEEKPKTATKLVLEEGEEEPVSPEPELPEQPK
jgi:hypothetical protein